MIPYMNLEEQVDSDFVVARRRALLRRVGARFHKDPTHHWLLSFDEVREASLADRRTYLGSKIVANLATADTTHMRDWLGGNSVLERKPAVGTAGSLATTSGRHRTRKRRNAMIERQDAADPATGSVRYVDPEGLHKNPAFTNVVVVEGPVRTVHVGGQNAVDASGNIVGKGDVAAQTEQVLANVRAALAAGDAGPEHVIKWNLLLVEGVSLQKGYSAFQRAWVDTPNPPAITAAFVAGLANPDFLVEMDAIAVVPL